MDPDPLQVWTLLGGTVLRLGEQQNRHRHVQRPPEASEQSRGWGLGVLFGNWSRMQKVIKRQWG